MAFTCTEYQPIRSVAKVIGSLLTNKSVSPPKSSTAASSPTPGPNSTRGSVTPVFCSNLSSNEGGNLPMSTETPDRYYSGVLNGRYQADILVHMATVYPSRDQLF
ncbi:uncharacterized protein METZ01_LOCUS422516 [marine metagenome]|uniref:Uncharacterized protein n=1 Tax=marine metagenome TaxID=408172 RepID=A0A382XF24_9ZZZZ